MALYAKSVFPKYLPDYNIKVEYEPLPNDVKQVLLENAGPDWIRLGYKRQLWSTFFTDIYVSDSPDEDEPTLLVFMDNDAMFFSPVTVSAILDETQGYKPRVIGTDCTFRDATVYQWVQTAEIALGLPIVADFMIAFPMYIYSDTISNCRKYLLNRYYS